MSDLYQLDGDEVQLSVADQVNQHAQLLSAQLSHLSEMTYPPKAQKVMRTFTPREASDILGVNTHTLRSIDDSVYRQFERDPRNNRAYTLENLWEIRKYLSENGKPGKWPGLVPTRSDGEKLQIICVANFKGGSAKTTTATPLAQYLAMQGLRTLAIDLDPQASMTSIFGLQPEIDIGDNTSLFGAIRYDEERVPIQQVIRKTYFHNLDLIPANLELMEYEHRVPTAINDGLARGKNAFYRSIHNALDPVRDDYDVIIIDAPPQLGYLTLGAVFASTGVLVTVHPSMIDVSSMSQFLNMLSDLMGVIEEHGGRVELDFLKYVFTRYNPNDHPQLNCGTLMRGLFADNVLKRAVLDSTAIAHAALEKKTIYEIDKGIVSGPTLTRALDSVNAVNGEIYELILSAWGRS